MQKPFSISFRTGIFLTLLFIACTAGYGQQLRQAKLVNTDRVWVGNFGLDISVEGNIAVIGSKGYSGSQTLSGAAFIYVRDSLGVWNKTQKLTPINEVYFGNFGHHAVVHQGEIIAIDNVSNNSSLYIFQKQGAHWVQTLSLPINISSPPFLSNDITAFGNWIAVSNSTQGQVNIFYKTPQNVWVASQNLTSPRLGSAFGSDVEISGNTMIIGERDWLLSDTPYIPMGAAHLYILNTISNQWEYKTTFNSALTDTADDFGTSLDIFGKYVAISAPREDATVSISSVNLSITGGGTGAVHIFEIINDSTVNELQTLRPKDGVANDFFGNIEFNLQGDLIIGSRGNLDSSGNNYIPGSGCAYYFMKNARDRWSEYTKFVAFDRDTFDYFGGSIASYDEGVLIGAHREEHDHLGLGPAITEAGSVYDFQFCWPVDTLLQFTSCDSVLFNNQYLTKSGIYYDSLLNKKGCDSIVIAEIEIPKNDSLLTVNACDSFTLFSNTYSQSGRYIHTYQNQHGCDSTIVLELDVLPKSSHQMSLSSCDTFVYNNSIYISDTTIYDTLINSKGCDSTITISLSIFQTNKTQITDTVCNDTIINYQNIKRDTVISELFANRMGCDSMVISNVVVINRYSHTELFGRRCPMQKIFIPNAFTPGNDNLNETFKIVGVPGPYTFTVFDRWGKMLYQNSNYDNSWNGTHRGKLLSTGTYIYSITYNPANYYNTQRSTNVGDASETIKGILHILR